MSQFWSQRTHDLTPYVPGEQPKDMEYIKLNTNENPYPPSDKVLAAIQAASDEGLRRYSDPIGNELKQAIADYYDVDISMVFFGNGSDEVLGHTFAALLKQDAPLLFPDISYSFYPVYCKLFGIESIKVPLNENFEIDINDYSIENGGIIFPNPNAPTSKALPLADIETLVQKNPNSVIVVDEAYVDFGGETAVLLTKKYPNVLVSQTFSKSRSLAGLRVGFAIGSPELIEGLERVKNSFHPYTLGKPALAGATASMLDVETFEKNRDALIATRDWSTQALTDLGFEVTPSSTNFVFAIPPEGHNAEDLYLALKAKGILVRYFKAPRIDKHLRISIGTNEEMQGLINALKSIIS